MTPLFLTVPPECPYPGGAACRIAISLVFKTALLKTAVPVFLLTFCLRSPLYAQTAELKFDRISGELGLSQNLITCLMQDRQGFLWVGTKDGLNRFDGYQFTVYQHDAYDSTSLSHNFVTTLLEDREGRLWVSTRNGLNLFDRDREVFHRSLPDSANPNSVSHAFVRRIVENSRESRGGEIWVATGGGLNKIVLPAGARSFAEASYTHFRRDPNNPNGPGSDNFSQLAVDGQGVVWAATRRDIYKLAPLDGGYADPAGLVQSTGQNAYQVSRFDIDPPDPEWKKLLEDESNLDLYLLYPSRDGGIWIWAGAGLIRRESETGELRYFNLLHERPPDFSWTLYEDRAGVVWIGFEGGLGRFDPGTDHYAFYGHESGSPHSLPQSGVNAILEDAGGVLWLGSNGNGLFRHDPKAERFAQYFTPPDAAGKGKISLWRGNSLRAICETSDGALWLGTADRKFFRLDRTTGAISQPPPAEWRVVYSMLQDKSGALWIGSSMGLFRMEWQDGASGQIDYFEPEPEDPKGVGTDWVYKVFEDRDGEIWIATHEKFSRLDRKTGKFVSYRYVAPDPGAEQESAFTFIHQDRGGAFWLGTADGLLRFDHRTGSFKRCRNDPQDRASLSHNVVRTICEDPLEPEKILWLGTAGGGLNRFDMTTEKFTHFTVDDGLPDMVIYAILSDNDNNLWMSTNHGLSRFNPRTNTFKNFDVNDGLQDNEFNSGSYFKSPSGELFFGGINGFNAFYPEDIRGNPHAPPIALTGFQIFNKPVAIGGDSPLTASISQTTALTLRHDQKVFSFEFAALDYTDPAKNRYAYKMENFDPDWQQAGTSRSATYTNLDPGEYVFRVKGANNDGVWNEEGASLNITILPPWWRTWWAYSFYVLFSLTALYVLRRFEQNRTRLKNRARMERIEAEKLRELDSMKSRFFANISHEFRTPLTLIMGQIDSLRPLFKDPALKTRLEMAFRNSRLLLRLINQLLDLSQLEAGRMKLKAVSGNVVPLLRSLTLSFESLAYQKRIDLHFNNTPDVIEIDHEPEKIERIMHNLLSNAFKFTPEGGRISVQLSVISDQLLVNSDQPLDKSLNTNHYLQITVRDSGVGISAEHLPHIFDRFYQADNSATRDPAYTGTGIGLALTKELVELHGGEISVTSEEGFGTTFTVQFPVSSGQYSESSDQFSVISDQPQAPESLPKTDAPFSQHAEPIDAPPLAESREPKVSGQKPTTGEEIILIVEDNEDVRAYLREHLKADFQVFGARDGEEGLAKALELTPDLVITDVMMPKMDGYALSKQLRGDEKTSHIPIIMLTARAEETDKIAGLEIGVDDYLTKPFSPNELQARVRNLIALRKRLRERFSGTTLIKPSEVTVASVDQKFLERLQEIVEANMENEDFDLQTLSAKTGMSERQLERKLKALIGQTPNQFVRSMRLQRAKQLLEQNAGTVSEIAYMVGFNSIPYFSKVFRKAFGKPPSEYLRKTI